MSGCQSMLSDYEFSPEEIEQTARAGGLLSLEIEFSRVCNFRCPYCYVADERMAEDEMTREESRDVIRQARALGARRIIILGGEPMVYPHIREMISFIRSEGMSVELFTNGSNMSAEMAEFMFDHGVKVVLKMNTRDKKLQDIMSGRKGANKIIQTAFDNLLDAGFPAPGKPMGVSTIICNQNVNELVEMWEWLRDQNIDPYFEMITPQGRARENDWLEIDEDRLPGLFQAIADLDARRYGREWDPQPPLVGHRCMRHQFSLVVTANGAVMPCVGITIPVGNVREKKLAEIIRDSEIIQDLRHYREKIKGPCASCAKAAECYGCRGAAYQLTGDYLASDPMCWRNREKQAEIGTLPVDVRDILPQKAPMRLVDRLVSVGERCAVTEVLLKDGSPFLADDGTLEEAAYVEVMAQAMAAFNAFRAMGNSEGNGNGFLLGARHLEILGSARVGDQLTVRVFKEAKLGDFGIIRGSVSRNGTELARGEIKVYHKSGDTAAVAG